MDYEPSWWLNTLDRDAMIGKTFQYDGGGVIEKPFQCDEVA